ncbi:hypothetical protein SD71_08905 [Cohnella kolymensis]|uniref:EfeO-type cupredoxin-like domain-containing protein n=1 Tax=Cohnella kolymensis TaxID=1590652 RepID=A0ABR5A6R5_9BACL|nr:cupredoxin domain-containing protein [Cohnella kolymensis]KIL36102.1 hypothetical protein SD71_08905 [Cohnella kolymensis]
MKKSMYTIGVVLAAALIATGCGGGGGNENTAAAAPEAAQAANVDASGAKAITINAKNFEFDQKEIKVKKGEKLSITLKNSQGNHAIQIEGYDQQIKGGKTVTFTADKAGEFRFLCSVMCGAGHIDMVGKLIVE